ncbi:trypsin-like serine protease [Arthrobacter sp. LAPM80]|uniref:trypsin-like serine protease n=1 Tax=Arthrobacter sp. LAPM80 TaxID=3141788 RepID=UPI00398AD27F
MRATKRAFFRRGAAACAAAAVLIGGSFAAGAASAAPSPGATPSSSAAPNGIAAGSGLPGGLAEAVRRDLGMSVEEFTSQAALSTTAAAMQAKLATADPAAVVSLDGDTINVKTSAPEVATAAAGRTKVKVDAVTAGPLAATKDAASIDALFAAYTAEFGTSNLQAIMVNADGNFVIRTGDAATGSPVSPARSLTAATETSITDFAAKYGNVVVEPAQGPAGALAGDVVNGQGYIAFDSQSRPRELCSIGWNGFNKYGAPAVISAGHCTDDGALEATKLTVPSQDDAGKPTTRGGAIGDPLGTFGFSQFGGPGNSPAIDPFSQNPSNIGTDVSVIDGINTALAQLPTVTDWRTPASPKDSGPQVTGVSDAILGTPICKSGRTTGWSCGTVSEVGVFLVGGMKYPANRNDIRAVRGFGSTSLAAGQGDSGGPIIAGTLAVGMVSAGVEEKDSAGVITKTTTYGVDLKDALAHTAGYSVKIFLNTPKVTTSAPVYRKGTVTGTVADAPAGTTVSVTINAATIEVPVAADGTWSVAAPDAFGTFSVRAQAKNGFSTSKTSEASIEVIKETVAAPAISTPTNGQEFAHDGGPSVISGTNLQEASVLVTVDGKPYDAVVLDGAWHVTLDAKLGSGNHTVTAVQTWRDIASPTATSAFKVLAETAPPATQEPTPAPTTAKPTTATPTTFAPTTNNLATTGASSSLLLLGGAGGLLLLGGAAFLLIRRRSEK